MARIIVELTNRCDLRCPHCFGERHASTTDLPVEVIERLTHEGHACGIDELCFSGGEPTIHRHFPAIVERVVQAGYTFSLVTHGGHFHRIAAHLLRYREACRGVTFSLDGARESTHDASRGAGAYRRVMRAATLCFFRSLPFTFNMVLTRQNRGEVREMIELAARLGSRGVRFGHLMFTPENAEHGLVLTPAERRDVEEEIWAMRGDARVPIGFAAGYFSASPFFACAPLSLEEYNVDCRGQLTLCCQLSGFGGPNDDGDIIADLTRTGLHEALVAFHARVETYLADKRQRVSDGTFDELDHFPCWYCVKYLGKVAASATFPGSDWLPNGAVTPFENHRVLTFHRTPRS